jgi:DNA-binding NarL/FixJ family response regulator
MSLTARQTEVVKLIAQGEKHSAIGSTLRISPKTVEHHRGVVCRALNLRGTAELVRYAVRSGLIEA